MRFSTLRSRYRGPAWRALATTLLAAVLVAGCGDDDGQPEPQGPVARFTLSPGTDFFAQPWPSDLRYDEDGTLALGDYPEGEVIVQNVIDVADTDTHGFAVGGAIYFTFSEEVDPTTLPGEGADSLDGLASVYLVDVDPDSPAYGERVPLWIKYAPEASKFIAATWLGLLPMPGYPLRPATTYAAVVTRGVLTAEGEPFGQDADFASILAGDDAPGIAEARAVFLPLLDYLAEQSIDSADVAVATVFTTHDVTGTVQKARAVVRALDPPSLASLTLVSHGSAHDVYEGEYDAPIFQQGEAPYRQQGGEIQVDANGDPVLARMESLRVALSVPTGAPMPAQGWPVVIYRHGTGGDYLTFTQNNTASRLAAVSDVNHDVLSRMAVIGIDGVVHGPRAAGSSGSPEELFYNVQNPMAGRDNSRQEAIDNFQLVRLVEAVDVASAPDTGAPIRFDTSRIYFFGHSQGAITGALFVPYEPLLQAAVLSGAGAHLLLTLLRKDTEIPISTMLEIALNDDDYGPLDEFHPTLNLLQTFIEPADPLAYARAYLLEPPAGQTPLNLFLSYGVGDTYTPNITTEALATTAGVSPAGEILVPYEALELQGPVTPLEPPVCDNYTGGAGTSSAVVVQYQPRPGDDGHFVVFDHMTAQRQSCGFLATHAADGCATLIQ